MATDPRKLRASDLCRLLNSTPLGEVITERQLQTHRTRAGLRIGDAKRVDLLRYTAWLVQQKHAPKPAASIVAETTIDIAEAAEGAAALGTRKAKLSREERRIIHKQESLIAALLTEPTYEAAAARAGVGIATVYRWLRSSAFRSAYREARRELVDSAIGRVQAASGQAIETLLQITRRGRRDSDRVRAAIAILELAMRGLSDADMLHGEAEALAASALGTTDVVTLISTRLRQLDQSELPMGEKSRLTATLADAVLRAISVDVLDKRLEALHRVLAERKDTQEERRLED